MPTVCRYLALLCCVCLSIFAKDEWLPISEEEKASKQAALVPEAPAEVLFRRISIDERDMPTERVVKEYIRYKIYSLDKSLPYTRLSKLFSDAGSSKATVKLSARLILPDGTVKVFGKEAIQERVVNESAGEKSLLRRLLGSSTPVVKEKFLAISGIEAGSILEYQAEVSSSTFNLYYLYLLQSPELPTRRAELLCNYLHSEKYRYRCFAINHQIGNSKLEIPQGKDFVKISATDLPPLPREPLSGTPGDYALTLFSSYDVVESRGYPRNVHKAYTVNLIKEGPWSAVAMKMFSKQEDCAYPTKHLKQVTADLVAGAATPLEKAQRIHRFVTHLYQEHRLLPQRKPFNPETIEEAAGPIHSLDELLDYAKLPDIPRVTSSEYLWLAMAMYECAGLECRGLLLSDRRLLRFHPRMSSPLLLPNMAAAVKIGDNWLFSMPHSLVPLPFDSTPWYCEAQPALWSRVGPQEFVDINPSPARFTLVGNAARLQLLPDGSLEGTGKRIYSGHAAEAMRGSINKKASPKAYFSRLLNAEFRKLVAAAAKTAQEETLEESEEKPETQDDRAPIVITHVKGVKDPEEHIEIAYTIRLPGFAFSAGQRLIIRPSIFRSEASALFSSSTRTTDIQFPFKLQELDDVIITLPPGLEPEGIEQPASAKTDTQFFRTQFSYDAAKHALKLRREFNSELLLAKPTSYPAIKAFYDQMAQADRQEILLKRTGAAAATNTEAATPAATTAAAPEPAPGPSAP